MQVGREGRWVASPSSFFPTHKQMDPLLLMLYQFYHRCPPFVYMVTFLLGICGREIVYYTSKA